MARKLDVNKRMGCGSGRLFRRSQFFDIVFVVILRGRFSQECCDAIEADICTWRENRCSVEEKRTVEIVEP